MHIVFFRMLVITLLNKGTALVQTISNTVPLLDFQIKPETDRSDFKELFGIKESSAFLSVSVLEVGGLP